MNDNQKTTELVGLQTHADTDAAPVTEAPKVDEGKQPTPAVEAEESNPLVM